MKGDIMIKLHKKSILSAIAGVVFLIGMLTMPAAAQDLEKKYAPIVGDYQFDMSESGMGVLTVQIYVENDVLWAWAQEMGDPGEMVPGEGEEFVFTIEDDMSIWLLTFQKDENGKYTKCHAVNEVMETDIIGEKIIE